MQSQQQPDDSVDNGLASWENEGGALAPDCVSDQCRRLELAKSEEHIFQRLGAGVVALWKDLPADIQRHLFSHATSGDTSGERGLTARLLHAASSERASPVATRRTVSGAISRKRVGLRSEYVRFGSAPANR